MSSCPGHQGSRPKPQHCNQQSQEAEQPEAQLGWRSLPRKTSAREGGSPFCPRDWMAAPARQRLSRRHVLLLTGKTNVSLPPHLLVGDGEALASGFLKNSQGSLSSPR
ncbi:hypothetical protein [Synechococcus sp. B60.2]|uniref:hypothetical protein n=2 Tax=unclassified Synechococcus TaxID=2626047 RepID=UPI0039C280EF